MHLVTTCCVVLTLVAIVEDPNYPNGERIIPIYVNNFRNSHLGIKPLTLEFKVETDETNKDDGLKLQDAKKNAEENPYVFESKNLNTLVKIEYQGFITMVYLQNSISC